MLVKHMNHFITQDSRIPNQSHSHVKKIVRLITYWLFALPVYTHKNVPYICKLKMPNCIANFKGV